MMQIDELPNELKPPLGRKGKQVGNAARLQLASGRCVQGNMRSESNTQRILPEVGLKPFVLFRRCDSGRAEVCRVGCEDQAGTRDARVRRWTRGLCSCPPITTPELRTGAGDFECVTARCA